MKCAHLQEAESSSAGLTTRLVNTRTAHWTTPLPGPCTRLTDAELAANGVVQCRPWKNSMIYRSDLQKEAIRWCPCTPPAKLEMFSKKSSASTATGKGIAGLKKKMKNYDDDDDDDTKIVKSRMSEFSCRRLKVRMRSLGTWIGRYGT